MGAIDELVILLSGEPIGYVVRGSDQSPEIRFDEQYVSQSLPIPLSVSMPTTAARYGAKEADPWLWGLLPDNEAVLNRWAARFDVSRNSSYELLSSPVGVDCAGAVQFCRDSDRVLLEERQGDLTPVTEAQVAKRIRELRGDSTSWLTETGGQFSLGGAQAKTALYFFEGAWGDPSGSIPTTHILKPAIVGIEDQHLNEHLCLTAARILGMSAAVSSVERFENETALIVERFDRVVSNDPLQTKRIHQEDFCQALSVHPRQKYQGDGGPGIAKIAALIRAHVPGAEAQKDVERFADALIFSWVIGGTDAHAKNYSFLLKRQGVSLAPLYDIASYLPYDTSSGHKIKMAMKLGGEYQLRRTDRPGVWPKVAVELGLNPESLIERAIQLVSAVPAALAASAVTIADFDSDLPAVLLDKVTERAHKCLAILNAEDQAVSS